MSTPTARLQLASPVVVAQALGDVGRHHWGIPVDALDVIPLELGESFFRFTQDGSLTPGDIYVDTLENWLEYIIGFGYAGEVVSAFLSVFQKGRRAAIAFTILGFFPVKIQIPKAGTQVFSPHGKIVLNGVFQPLSGADQEIWSASMSYDVVGPDVGAMPATVPAATLQAVAEAWRLVIEDSTGGNEQYPNNVVLREVAYYRAEADGRATGGQWQRHFLTPEARGFTPTGYKPYQIANVITLDAQGPRGGRFGRFYMPAHAAPIQADGRYTGADVASALGNIRTALTTVNTTLSAAIEGDVELVVASGRGNGENRPVRQLRIGRVPDTMRSRRNNLVEEYSVQPFQAIP